MRAEAAAPTGADPTGPVPTGPVSIGTAEAVGSPEPAVQGCTPGAAGRPGAEPGRDTAREPAGGPLLLGVRHHGPGSARAVWATLEARQPRVLLVEGPAEADSVVALAGDEAMRPPVALLAHAVNEPGRAVFWPLAGFSPEWVAVRWALEREVPVRFIDLPAAHVLALSDEAASREDGSTKDEDGRSENDLGHAEDEDEHEENGGAEEGDDAGERGGGSGGSSNAVRSDPLAVLAEAAGYEDAEAWWEDVVEHRQARAGADPYAPFAVLAEAMTALREGRDGTAVDPGRSREHPDDPDRPAARNRGPGGRALSGHRRDLLREAHMRLRLRDAVREFGADGVAVVCGAWHVPALAAKAKVTDDRRLLKGLPKSKTEITWVPWTHRRLARRSGYGAGVTSPGWYQHLFDSPDRALERWMAKVAGLLREEDHGVSSADVIEAVRLADSLSAVRGRPVPGLAETLDAVRAVMCAGSDVPLALVRERLVVGDALGEVPEGAPAVPLQRDLDRQQRRLRLRPEARERELDLDLRKETDAARSRLLHRLCLLGVDWGVPARSRTGGTGTFRESWRLCWQPESAVRTAEAGVWGTTVESAATERAKSQAAEATAPAEVTALAERCLLAELPGALPVVMRSLADRAALDSDVGRLAEALPALARSVRYGTVRGTGPAGLTEVARGIAERVCVGLPPACSGLDADGAERMRRHIDAVHRSMALLAQAETAARRPRAESQQARSHRQTLPHGQRHSRQQAAQPVPARPRPGAPARVRTEQPPPAATAERPGPLAAGEGRAVTDSARSGGLHDGVQSRWRAALRRLTTGERTPGLIRGRCVRLLLDEGELTQPDAGRLMSRALSPGTPPPQAAAWIEGFLAGDGMLLVHDERLLAIVDGWLASVPDAAFTAVLPLLRRTFAGFEPGARRTLGELVRRGGLSENTHGTPGGPFAPAGRSLGLRPVRAGFGPGLDESRAAAVLPVLRRLLPDAEPDPAPEWATGPPVPGQVHVRHLPAGDERSPSADAPGPAVSESYRVAPEPSRVTYGSDPVASEPSRRASEPVRAMDDSGYAADEPDPAANDPDPAANDPGPAANEPGRPADGPGRPADGPRRPALGRRPVHPEVGRPGPSERRPLHDR